MKFEITPTSTATGVGLFCATSFFAVSTCITFLVIPTLCLPAVKSNQTSETKAVNASGSKPGSSPSHLARQWQAIYNGGIKAGPFTNGIGAASWLCVAGVLPAGETRARSLYIAGAICLVAVVPFTFLVMGKVVRELSARAATAESAQPLQEETSSGSDDAVSTAKVIEQWSRLNAIRGLFGLAGIACIIAANV